MENKYTNYEYSLAMYNTLETKRNMQGVSNSAKDDVEPLIAKCRASSSTASKEIHYDHLNEWQDPLYEYISKMLKKYGFRNGDKEYNDKYPDICFWWGIYGIISNIYISPNLHSITEIHHSSAWERNEALIKELEFLLADPPIEYEVWYQYSYVINGKLNGGNDCIKLKFYTGTKPTKKEVKERLWNIERIKIPCRKKDFKIDSIEKVE